MAIMLLDEGYKTLQGTSCLTACMQNYLNATGIPLDETHMMLNSASELIYYKGRPYNQNYLEIDCGKGIDYLTETCHLSYTNEVFQDKKEKEFLDYCIENNLLITLLVDAKSLTYSNVFRNSTGTKHAINLIGKNESMFFISDGFIPSRKDDNFHGYIEVAHC